MEISEEKYVYEYISKIPSQQIFFSFILKAIFSFSCQALQMFPESCGYKNVELLS